MAGRALYRQTKNPPDTNTGGASLDNASEREADPGILEAAAYIQDIAADLRDIAQAAQLPLLAYLLDIARLEAKAQQK